MTTLLVILGAAIAGVVGFVVGRGRRPGTRAVRPDADPSPPVARTTPTFADLVDGHPAGVVVADVTGRITYRNSAAGRSVGTHVAILLDASIERAVSRAIAGDDSHETLDTYGPPKSVLTVHGRPTPTGGAVVFVEDVTEQRHVEQMRTDFVANISHELKTPIGAMSVLAEMLEDETDPATTARLVGRLITEADRASRTIDDLMDLSRLEAGGETLAEPVSIADVVHDAIGRVGELAARRGIHISTLDPVDDDGPRSDAARVLGDRGQLVSALGNLVENAVKYSEDGGVVQVRVRTDETHVDVSVVDHGVGIPQRDLQRVFERFYRVDRARSRETGGTGLGLSIVRHVASNHHGEVLVTSVEGDGSTFTLRLPLAGHREPAADDTVRSGRHTASAASSASPDREGVA
ncbi:MAG: ATP-binding protein [Ilumatobacteraceae bacterium]